MAINDEFYLSKKDNIRDGLLELRKIILAHQDQISETTKYGMPCFCFNNKPLCYLWTDKKTNEPYVLFVKGNLIDHPFLEQGSRSKMKIFRVDPNQDIDIQSIKEIIIKSILLY